MSPPIVFKDVAPVMPVRDLQAALERYRQLGFEVRAYGHGTGYGYAQRGAVSIHLSEWSLWITGTRCCLADPPGPRPSFVPPRR